MKTFKLRRNIERSTNFKVEYAMLSGDGIEPKDREFKSMQSLAQWVVRNEAYLGFMEFRRLALIDDVWEPYTTIGKKAMTLSDMKSVVRGLEDDSYKQSK